MSKTVKRVAIVCGLVVIVLAVAFLGIYHSRLQTMSTIEEVQAFDDGYSLYRMEVKYGYDLDEIIGRGITDDQSMIDAIVKEAIPILPVHVDVPSFGCTAFTMKDTGSGTMMGRNYDFKLDTSAMLVYCSPEGGYRSVAFAALDNISTNHPSSFKEKMACLTAPFICLDGMNEKGVSIAVLTLDSEPTDQDSGKEKIFTSLAIRLVLDRAASTEEAVELLAAYDMFAANGRDYHFYITDSTGDGRVVEYDCDSPTREMTVTKTDAVTNFFVMYADKVLPDQKNGHYGHGKERYNTVMGILESETEYTEDTAWKALVGTAQDPNPDDPTSNTQWSIVYNNSDLTAHIVIRQHWDQKISYSLDGNTVEKAERSLRQVLRAWDRRSGGFAPSSIPPGADASDQACMRGDDSGRGKAVIYARHILGTEGEGGREYPGRANNPGRPQAGPSSDLLYSRSKTFARMRIASSKASRIFILPILDGFSSGI